MKRIYLAATFLVGLGAAIVVAEFAVQAVAGFATNWLTASTFSVNKTLELPQNTEPTTYGYECEPVDFKIGLNNDGSQLHGCAAETPVGTIANGYVLKGAHGTLSLNRHNTAGAILPSPAGSNLVVMSHSISTSLTGVGVFVSAYDPSLFKFVTLWGVPMIYEYQYAPTNQIAIKDGTNTVVPFSSATSIAYSANGKWMVGLRTDGAVVRVSMDTLRAKVIGWERNYTFSETKGMNLAVSDDGQFIAINSNIGDKTSPRPGLRVYDANSCRDLAGYTTDQNGNLPAGLNQCEYNDVWNGVFRSGSYPGNIKTELPAAEYPRHIRFLANDILSFDAVYARTSATNFQVARYTIANDSTEPSPISLLGMGDSYISGEGAAGTYFYGTDTSSNKCHLSYYSYPYRIGYQMFVHGNSVACAGAKMFDVSVKAGDPKDKITSEDAYTGQIKEKNSTKWADRNKEMILNSFTPGYAQQTIFSEKYHPRTTLLSIGGNDIHFSHILSSCVTSTDACYHYYEDREQLMQDILDQYDRLVDTYQDVLAKSNGRVYVVAYPQVAKPGGNCGANVHLNAEEVQFSAQLITYLNSVIKRAAAEAGVYYVDTESALNGHRLCEAPKNQAGMNGLTKGNDKFGLLGNESYHPTSLGHSLLAQAIMSKTSNLTKPMPTPIAQNKPTLDGNNALLANAPKQQTIQPSGVLKWGTDNTIPMVKGGTYTIKWSQAKLQPGTQSQIVLHSDPITLYSGVLPSGDTNISIPTEIEPGFHTLDIYGIDENGQKIDYRQSVYIAESSTDYDGDGLANEIDTCVVVPQSGVDEDGDGVDDACDGDIADPNIAPDEVPALPDVSPLALEATPSEDVYVGSFLAPYIPLEEAPGDNSGQNQNGGTTVPPDEKDNSGSTSPSVPSQPIVAAVANTQPNTIGFAMGNEAGLNHQNNAVLGDEISQHVPLGAKKLTTEPEIQTKHLSVQSLLLIALPFAALVAVMVLAFKRKKHY